MPRSGSATLLRTPHTRVWLIENGAGPANAPEYLGLARALGASWPQGTVTPVRAPSEERYDVFVDVDEVVGQQGLPTLPIEVRSERQLSTLLKLIRKQCVADVQIHIGACQDPTDFDAGWEVVSVLERGRASDYSTGDQGAFDADQNAPVVETVPFIGRDYYQIKRVTGAQQAAAVVTDEVQQIVVCDSVQCGECGIESDGCQVAFAVMTGVTGSPGLATELAYTETGGSTWASTNVTTMALADTPTAMACVGPYLVVLDAATNGSLHYALIADILNGSETWTELIFGSAENGQAIFSLGRTRTWVVGTGGFIWFFEDITAAPTTQTSGDVTSEALNGIDGLNRNELVAVGDNGAVLVTDNGGVTWALATAPAAVNLNKVWMRSKSEWFVAGANGTLYYTRDGGESWSTKAFPGSGAGVIYDIKFSTPTVGWMAHATAAAVGRILRTINGGQTWYVLPEEAGISLPAADRYRSLAVCDDPNTLFAGGLADDGSDGIIIKVA